MNQHSSPKFKAAGDVESTRTKRALVATPLIAATVNYAISCGVSMTQITAATGIKRAALIDNQSRLPEESIPTIWSLLNSSRQGPSRRDLSPGLHMVSGSKPTVFGQYENLVRYAPNLRSALKATIRFGKVVTDSIDITLTQTDAITTIHARHPMDRVDGGNAAEVGLATMFQLIQEAQGENFSAGVDFSHQPNGTLAAYETFFGVPVRFGQRSNAIHFRNESLENPMQDADEHLFRYAISNLELIEDRWLVPGERSVLSRAYAGAKRNAEQGRFTANELAIEMGISLRKLQRELKLHGLTVTTILAEARETLAKKLLDDRSNRMHEIATRLDYSDARAFRRAFTRWTGQSPTSYRKHRA
ncbi:MAG: AraC family transcriptional regulator ligand-binding domain-containing protein [Planctomycetota bacterium]